jgi:UDP-glucuronate 4-epimerase
LVIKTVVTGAAGFIGFHTAKRLIERGDEVVGYDAVNDYYDPALKRARLSILEDTAAAGRGRWTFLHADASDQAALNAAFDKYGFDGHLFRLPTTGLRSSRFTAHGARPDMALFLFTKNILAGKPIWR